MAIINLRIDRSKTKSEEELEIASCNHRCKTELVKCRKISQKSFNRCTLPKDHKGPHIACGIHIHNMEIWNVEN